MPSKNTLLRVGFVILAIALAYLVEAIYHNVPLAGLVLVLVGWALPMILLDSESTPTAGKFD